MVNLTKKYNQYLNTIIYFLFFCRDVKEAFSALKTAQGSWEGCICVQTQAKI